jgi:hypothetical protein
MYGSENSPSYQKLHPAFLIMCPLMVFMICNRFSQLYIKRKLEIYFLLFLSVSVIYIYLNGLTGSIAYIPNTLLLPICFSICLNERDFSFLIRLRKLIILFFIFNSTLAIVERLIEHNFFISDDYYYLFSHFRSSAFQGHPLNNALVTSVIIAFILTSNLKERNKNMLLLLGLASIVCYGARSSIIAWAIMLPVYLFAYKPPINQDTKNFRKKGKHRILSGVIILLIIALIIAYTPYGGRIFELRSLDDDSVGARMEALHFFTDVNIYDFLWGTSVESVEKVSQTIGVEGIENFWILWLIRFGLVMAVCLSFLFVKFLYQKVKCYGKFASFFIPIICLAIASTNNSLSSNTSVISIYVLCSYAFAPFMHKTQK